MIDITEVESWRKKNGLTQAEVARLFQVDLQRYNNWIYRGSLPKNQLQKALEITKASGENVISLQRPAGLVPVISWVQAGNWCESPDNFAPGSAEEWLMCPPRHSARTYALKVVGDSMTSPLSGERSYPHGTIIFVDPDKPTEIGSRVIARLPNSSEATFKVYSEDAGVPYLIPLNTRYPAIQMPLETQICGVVIGSYWPE